MFLTKQGLQKIIILAVCYFILGSLCIAFAIYFTNVGIDATFLFVLGVIVYVLNILVIVCDRYTEGKGKLIELSNKLVCKELKPAEFIRHYEALKSSDDLILKKASVDVLQQVAFAYDLLEDKENVLATVNEMVEIAGEKRKAYATLIKTAYLFSYDQVEEAEQLFDDVRKQKLGPLCNYLVDSILKSDRAMAMGDYKTVEAYCLKSLECKFPKGNNVGKLVHHYTLGKVYEKTGDAPKAIAHYQYCVENGGETALKLSAESAIARLQ